MKLQEELGLPVNKDIPLLAMVSRLTWQKGLDIFCGKRNSRRTAVYDNTEGRTVGFAECRNFKRSSER